MLGELDQPLERIEVDHYLERPRKEIKEELKAVRTSLRRELQKFCERNFSGVSPDQLGALYEDIRAHDSQYRLPLQEFVRRVGQPRAGILKGAPAHATVCISCWGLQTEYPEMHLARDVALSFNDVLDAEARHKSYGRVSWSRAKGETFKREAAGTLNRLKYSMRMCLLSCFNLVEAYINGISWEFVQVTDTSSLSKNQLDLLTKGQASLLDKLAKVPAIVVPTRPPPLAKDADPLASFRDLVKPFRDSAVHASPFSAAERFGGYDKLDRVYELATPTIRLATDLSLQIIREIHGFLQNDPGLPAWMPAREPDGRFIVEGPEAT